MVAKDLQQHSWALSPAPVDPILSLTLQYRADSSPNAVNLGVGTYRDAHGNSTELRCVKEARCRIEKQNGYVHDYLPIEGDESLHESVTKLVLGACVPSECIACVQTISGSGALRLALDFLVRVKNIRFAYVSQPSWPNHSSIVHDARMELRWYRYYREHRVSIDEMITDLQDAPRGSVVILHACAHNPTGADLSHSEWERVADVVQKRELMPLFDVAYQGFASGDVQKDVFAVRMFCARGIVTMIAHSFSKSLGLYNSRVGTLSMVLNEREHVPNVLSHLKWIARAMYSSPPAHGARIAATVLQDEALTQMWKTELAQMVDRTRRMRLLLHDALIRYCPDRDWHFVTERCGMFVRLGLDQKQVHALRCRFHIYVAEGGRINVSGLTEDCVDQVARAIACVITCSQNGALVPKK